MYNFIGRSKAVSIYQCIYLIMKIVFLYSASIYVPMETNILKVIYN